MRYKEKLITMNYISVYTWESSTHHTFSPMYLPNSSVAWRRTSEREGGARNWCIARRCTTWLLSTLDSRSLQSFWSGIFEPLRTFINSRPGAIKKNTATVVFSVCLSNTPPHWVKLFQARSQYLLITRVSIFHWRAGKTSTTCSDSGSFLIRSDDIILSTEVLMRLWKLWRGSRTVRYSANCNFLESIECSWVAFQCCAWDLAQFGVHFSIEHTVVSLESVGSAIWSFKCKQSTLSESSSIRQLKTAREISSAPFIPCFRMGSFNWDPGASTRKNVQQLRHCIRWLCYKPKKKLVREPEARSLCPGTRQTPKNLLTCG